MDLRKLSFDKFKIFDSYSSLDVPTVREMSRCGIALIGGSAVQTLANYYKVKPRRQRSINDIDGITSGLENKEGIQIFKNSLNKWGFEPIKMGDSDFMLNYENSKEGVEVDVLISYEQNLVDRFITVSGMLFMDPCYMFLSKVQRITSGLSNKNDTDIQDLNTLYDIIEVRGEINQLQDLLSNSPVDIDENTLNSWLQE